MHAVVNYLIISFLSLILLQLVPYGRASPHNLNTRAGNSTSGIQWGSCGEGYDSFQCANISVPLDHNNVTDTRTINIFIARLPASNTTHCVGSLFVNPGGPGGSGSQIALLFGQNVSTVLKGQYDIIGFDPRGVKFSEPYISCFDSLLDEEIWLRTVRRPSLNLPSNVTADVVDDLTKELTSLAANVSPVSAQCYERVGDFIRFVGQ